MALFLAALVAANLTPVPVTVIVNPAPEHRLLIVAGDQPFTDAHGYYVATDGARVEVYVTDTGD